jgi:5-methylcytosine-specific restriction enzyme subunit McrC
LIYTDNLDEELKSDLAGLYRRLRNIDEVQLSRSIFSRVQLHQNNAFYDFLLKICALIYDNLLISEEPGKSKFYDFLQDRRKMAQLFEAFVRNFYKIETDYKVYSETIRWDALTFEGSEVFLPIMTTDISVENKDSKVVIDTKYYRKALIKRAEVYQEKVRSTHLFQLFSYLRNLATTEGGINKKFCGILLYPTVEKDIDLEYIIHGHKIMVRTINLNQSWKLIRNDLINILETALHS